MIQTIADPEAISFQKDKNINLYLLKNQIDRRILKITSIVNELPIKRSHTSRSHCSSMSQLDQSIQIEAIKKLKATQKLLTGVNNVKSLSLIPKHSTQQRVLIQIKENNFKIMDEDKSLVKNERSMRTKSRCYQKQNFEAHLMPMIESNSFTFNACKIKKINENELSLLNLQKQQGYFSDNEDSKYLVPNVQMCSSVIQQQQTDIHTKIINNSGDFSNDITSSLFIDLSKTSFMKHETNHKITMNRKAKYPNKNIVLSPAENRVQVTDKCVQQMHEQVDLLIPKRRKQAHDNKLRLNVLKSIQDKYKEDMTN